MPLSCAGAGQHLDHARLPRPADTAHKNCQGGHVLYSGPARNDYLYIALLFAHPGPLLNDTSRFAEVEAHTTTV